MSQEKGIVRLWNLPSYIYIDITPELKSKIIFRIKEKYINYFRFAKELRWDENRIYHLIKGNKVSLEFILDIIKKLNISKEDLEKNVSKIGLNHSKAIEITNPNLPFNFRTNSGMILLSAIFHDGGISSDLRPFYVNFERNMRDRVLEAFKNIFGEFEGKWTDTEKDYLIFPKVIGIILVSCLDIKPGSKTLNNVYIPKFIFGLKNDLKAEFLKQTFDDEGSVSNYKSTREIQLILSAKKGEIPKLLSDDRKLLLDLGVYTAKPFLKTEYLAKKSRIEKNEYGISVSGTENLKIFSEKVGFTIEKKNKDLIKIINAPKRLVFPLNIGHYITLWYALKLEKMGKAVSCINLAKIMKKHRGTISYHLKKLEKDNLIEKTQKGISIYPDLFSVTEKGEKFVNYRLSLKAKMYLKHYPKGDLGYRGKEINELLERMI